MLCHVICCHIHASSFFNFEDYFSKWTCVSQYQCLLWILLELRIMEVVVTAGDYRCENLQSNDHHQQTNTSYLQFRCPSCHPTNGVNAQLQLTVIYNDDKPKSCDISSARITTNKKILSACKSVDV